MGSHSPIHIRCLALTLAVFAGWTSLAAQTSTVTATLAGTVVDPSGAAVAGAKIRLRNPETEQAREAQSDGQGAFRMSGIPVGTYELRVEHAGFAAYARSGVTLTLGQILNLEIRLAPPRLEQQVTVSESTSPLEVSEATLATNIDSERIEELPVRSRNYLNFVLLAPGVVSSGGQTGAPGAAQSQLPSSGFSFGGLRPRSNNISIDGMDNNDEYTGEARTELSLETVREFQVVNNGVSAEFGGASGGSINVVTRSGVNIHHGDAFIFAQNGALDARPGFLEAPGKPDLNRYRVGFALGGPIRKNRTFFYSGFEQEHNRAQSASDVTPQAAAAINGFLATGAFPGLALRQVSSGFFPVTRAETEASGRLDHQLSQSHSLMLRYAFTNNRVAGDAFNTGGFTDASARGSSFVEDQALTGSLASILNSGTVNDLRFQLSTRRVVMRTGDTTGPGIEIPGVISLGRPYEGNGHRRENHYAASDTVALGRGAHLFKAGGTINRVRLRAHVPDGFGGLFFFPDLGSFFSGSPDSFRQGFGNPRTDYAVTALGMFVQDHWTATRQLTLDLGTRYDFEKLPSLFSSATHNFSPRLGLAYSPGTRWVLRAGYGVYFDRYLLAALNRVLQRDGTQAAESVADGPAAAAFFRSLTQFAPRPPAPVPSIYSAAANLPTSYSQQASLSAEYELAKDWTVGINYLFVRGVKLARTVNTNLAPPLPAGAALPGQPLTPQQLGRELFGGARLDPRFNDVYQLQDAASSSYHGATVRLNRRMSDEIEFSASYTLSKAIDDASDFEEQPQNPYKVGAERAVSRNNQGQRFVFNGLFDLPFGDEEDRKPGQPQPKLAPIFGNIELAPILTIGSGFPVDPLTGGDSNLSHPFPLSARPLGLGRDSLRLPYTAVLDLRILKYFMVGKHGKLDVVAESFNLLNRLNVSEISPFYGTGAAPLVSFTEPMGALNPRQLQFSLDFEF